MITAWHRSNETSKRLDEIPGVGPVLATALVASVADPKAFRSGRNFSAWIGLVPKQHSSGGKDRLGSISKQGDRYLRSLFVAGALAVIRYAKIHGTKHRPWLTALLARRPTRSPPSRSPIRSSENLLSEGLGCEKPTILSDRRRLLRPPLNCRASGFVQSNSFQLCPCARACGRTMRHIACPAVRLVLSGRRRAISPGASSVPTNPNSPANPSFLVASNRDVEVCRTKGDQTGLPISELSGRSEINVQKIWIAAIQCKGSWTPRQLGTIGNMIEVSTPDRVDR